MASARVRRVGKQVRELGVGIQDWGVHGIVRQAGGSLVSEEIGRFTALSSKWEEIGFTASSGEQNVGGISR